MIATATLRTLDFDEALASIESGACFIDVRDVDSYLDVHIPRSIEVLYEAGPGFNSRARDCIPLHVPLILLDLGTGDMMNAAASLRGKGFDVLGKIEDGINRWAGRMGTPASTEVVFDPPQGLPVLDVSDPGAEVTAADISIPIETLWSRANEVDAKRVVVAAGFGVRAAIAVGILEQNDREAVVWKTREPRG